MKPTIDESTKRSVTLLPSFHIERHCTFPCLYSAFLVYYVSNKFSCSGFGSPYVMFIIFISCFALSAASPPELLLNSTYMSFVFFLIVLVFLPILLILYCCSDISNEPLSNFPLYQASHEHSGHENVLTPSLHSLLLIRAVLNPSCLWLITNCMNPFLLL